MGTVLQLFHLASTACRTNTGALPSLYDNIPCPDGHPVLHSVHDLVVLIANAVRILISVSGSLAIIMLLLAAIYYITATGDPGRLKKAKDIIFYTVVGLVLILMSYAIVTYIAGHF